MTEPKSPLEALLARIGRLLEDTAGSGVAEQVQQVVADFLATFRLVPKKDFDEHLAELQELKAQVDELSSRIEVLEREDD